jgi:hypothetical protein
MGAIFRPKDLDRGKRSVINNAIKDFAPDTLREFVVVSYLVYWLVRMFLYEYKHLQLAK